MRHVVAPNHYRIVVRGRLGRRLADLFDDVEIDLGYDETVMTGVFADQTQLHGLLERLRDYGIHLLSVSVADLPAREITRGERRPG